MKTLEDAWDWYVATKRSLGRMQRLGEKHWADPSLAGESIWQDDHFRMLGVDHILADTTASMNIVDDLAIVVMFSVFESHVRDHLNRTVMPHAAAITDPILKQAADDAIQGITEGSFYRRVLEPLKDQSRIPAGLAEQVDQVRKFRNWVAHGRRDAPANNVTPKAAYDRLREFLIALGVAVKTEQSS